MNDVTFVLGLEEFVFIVTRNSFGEDFLSSLRLLYCLGEKYVEYRAVFKIYYSLKRVKKNNKNRLVIVCCSLYYSGLYRFHIEVENGISEVIVFFVEVFKNFFIDNLAVYEVRLWRVS